VIYIAYTILEKGKKNPLLAQADLSRKILDFQTLRDSIH